VNLKAAPPIALLGQALSVLRYAVRSAPEVAEGTVPARLTIYRGSEFAASSNQPPAMGESMTAGRRGGKA
jgi:hypothetical protein